jgi:hypothetical protein
VKNALFPRRCQADSETELAPWKGVAHGHSDIRFGIPRANVLSKDDRWYAHLQWSYMGFQKILESADDHVGDLSY